MVSDIISVSRVISHGDRSKGVPQSEIVPWSERVYPGYRCDKNACLNGFIFKFK